MHAVTARRIVGVRFVRAGRVFYFDAGPFELRVDDAVVCETPAGPSRGRVVIAPDQVLASELIGELPLIVRPAGRWEPAKAP